MIKKLINKISENKANKITEEVYIDRIALFEKECWRNNLNQDSIFAETRKYINKLNLSEEMHPFLIEFRSNLNKVYKAGGCNHSGFHELFRSFHEYRSEIKKENLN